MRSPRAQVAQTDQVGPHQTAPSVAARQLYAAHEVCANVVHRFGEDVYIVGRERLSRGLSAVVFCDRLAFYGGYLTGLTVHCERAICGITSRERDKCTDYILPLSCVKDLMPLEPGDDRRCRFLIIFRFRVSAFAAVILCCQCASHTSAGGRAPRGMLPQNSTPVRLRTSPALYSAATRLGD